jgi:NTE family protein
VIEELSDLLPKDALALSRVQELIAHGCPTRMHIVRLMAPRLDHDDQTKDVDFSRASIERRWSAGYVSAMRAIERAPWRGVFDTLDGVVLHELVEDWEVAAGDHMRAVAPGALPTKPHAKADARNGAAR